LINEYKNGKSLMSYNKIKFDRSTDLIQITLTEYIRHQIHHENTLNTRFTNSQLKQSIDMMRSFINSKNTNN